MSHDVMSLQCRLYLWWAGHCIVVKGLVGCDPLHLLSVGGREGGN